MNARERYLETLLFGQPDRIPLTPGGPRESTLLAWHRQGLPDCVPYHEALSSILCVPPEAFDTTETLSVSFRMIPTFEERILEHRDGHYIIQDWMGATTEISDAFDYTYIRSARDFVTRKWHNFPVSSPEDFERLQWRYDARAPERLAANAPSCRTHVDASARAVAVSFNGPFWQLREWVGMENLCLLMLDQPAFVERMVAFWHQFVLQVLEATLRRTRVDVVLVSEDMAYKAHSMISPAMARRFLLPSYQAWWELCRSYGCQVYDMDSDGYVAELLPVWIEGGFNCCNPIEVAAGNDLPSYRARFGTRMAYRGGIDKRALAAGGNAMREEVQSKVPALLAGGGYIPGCDHAVPPDISWDHYVAYARLLARFCGWL